MNARTLCVAGTMMMAMATGHEARAQAVTGSGGELRAARQDTGAVIVRWNQLLQSTLAPPGNPLTARTYALMHVAMFDAVNAIERNYGHFHVPAQPQDSGASYAAAVQAAHDILVALNPAATVQYDAALATDLGDGPAGFVQLGTKVGSRIAATILAWRQQDGWIVTQQPPYSEPPLPGRWQPTPPAGAAAAFTHLQAATPLAALSSTQFLPPPPPRLDSRRYADAVVEVALLGRVDSGARTADQTNVARLWSAVGTTTGFFAVWNNVARDVVEQRNLTLVEAARVFALVNTAIHDALQTTQTSKFVYGMWRPVTAIRAADTDLNPDTAADTTWLPLITTPPYPSYAGNLATIGASAARVLQLVCETNDVPISITWKQAGGPDITRQFAGFQEAADEEFMARIYGGVHFRFDQEAGRQVGRAVAEFVFTNYMTPR